MSAKSYNFTLEACRSRHSTQTVSCQLVSSTTGTTYILKLTYILLPSSKDSKHERWGLGCVFHVWFFSTPLPFRAQKLGQIAMFFFVFSSPLSPLKVKKYGQFGRFFNVWDLIYTLYHSEHKKHSQIGCVFCVLPLSFLLLSPLLSLKNTPGFIGLFSSISHSYPNMKNAAELAALSMSVFCSISSEKSQPSRFFSWPWHSLGHKWYILSYILCS